MVIRILGLAFFSTLVWSCATDVTSAGNMERGGGYMEGRDGHGARRYKGCCDCLRASEESSDEEEGYEEEIQEASLTRQMNRKKESTPNDRYLPLAQGPNKRFYLQTTEGGHIGVKFEVEEKNPFSHEEKHCRIQIPDFCRRDGFVASIPPTRRNPYGRDQYNSKKLETEVWTTLYIPTEVDSKKISIASINTLLGERNKSRISTATIEKEVSRKTIVGANVGLNGRSRSERRKIFVEEQEKQSENESHSSKSPKKEIGVESSSSDMGDSRSERELKEDSPTRRLKSPGVSGLDRTRLGKSSFLKTKGDVKNGDIDSCLGLETYPHWIRFHSPIATHRELQQGDDYPTLLEAILILLENPALLTSTKATKGPIRTNCVLDKDSRKTIAVSYNPEELCFSIEVINPDRDKHTSIPVRNITNPHVEATNCGLGPCANTPVFCCGHFCVRPQYLFHGCYCPPSCKTPCGVTTKCCECGINNCCCAFPCCCLLPCAYCPAIPGVCIEPTSSTCCERFECSLKGICWCLYE